MRLSASSVVLFLSLVIPFPASPQSLDNSDFKIEFSSAGITSLKRVHDKYDTDYIARGHAVGDLIIRYRATGGGTLLIVRPADGRNTGLVLGANRADATALGFDEGPVFPESYAYLEARGVAIEHGLLREEAASVMELYRREGGQIYNK